MSDIFSIISKGAATSTPQTSSKYVNVDPQVYEGSWEGKYSDNSKFKFDISQVHGFRAQVRYSSGTTVKFQQVLIKDNAFKIGDSKFTVTRAGHATIKTVVVDPVTGGTVLNTAPATKTQ